MRLRKEFVRSVYSGLARLRTFDVVDAVLEIDMYLYRTAGEREDVQFLVGVGDNRISE